MTVVLGARALNRATLARQWLLDRRVATAAHAVEHLVGMQSQAPNAPYVGLWSRLVDFAPEALAELVAARRVVRAPLMRATIHLVTADDCLALRPALQPMLERQFRGSPFPRQLDGVDMDAVVATGIRLLAERPRTRAELRPLLEEAWPAHAGDALCYAVTYLAPLIQVPPRGLWGRTGPPAWAPAATWLGRSTGSELSLARLVQRYLAAYGPASVMDAQAWSGLTRLQEVVDRLRPDLVRFRGEDGGELFDLPDAPRPDPDTPAPARFLPEYDNVQFAHADRRRVLADGRKPPLFPGNGANAGTLLVDGRVAGLWRIAREGGRGPVTLTVSPWQTLAAPAREDLAREGAALVAFTDPDADAGDVRFTPADG